MSELLMYTIWVRNDATGESAQSSVPEAFKDAWDNACEDFGKSSSGAPPISRAHVGVRLRDGRTVFRRPAAFASRQPYNESEERKEFEVPTCSGDAAKTHAQLVDEEKAEYSKPKPAK